MTRTLAVGSVLVIPDAGSVNLMARVDAEVLLLYVRLLNKGPCCLNIAIVLEIL